MYKSILPMLAACCMRREVSGARVAVETHFVLESNISNVTSFHCVMILYVKKR